MGTLIDDLISQISDVIDQDSLRIKNISKGFRFTGTMLENGSSGICFSIFNQEPINSCEYIRSMKSMKDLDVNKIIHFAKNIDSNLEKVIGIATINAVSQHVFKKTSEKYQLLFDDNPIEHVNFQENDRVVMIGNIGGFLPKIRELVEEVVVIDERLKNMNLPYIKNPEATQAHLNSADIVIITGSSIVNNTLEELLEWSTKAKEIVVVGPTAGFVAEPLFRRGVTILSSLQVLNPSKVLDIIAEGGGTPHFKKFCRKYNIIRK